MKEDVEGTVDQYLASWALLGFGLDLYKIIGHSLEIENTKFSFSFFPLIHWIFLSKWSMNPLVFTFQNTENLSGTNIKIKGINYYHLNNDKSLPKSQNWTAVICQQTKMEATLSCDQGQGRIFVRWFVIGRKMTKHPIRSRLATKVREHMFQIFLVGGAKILSRKLNFMVG